VSIPVNAHIEVVGGTACDDCNFDLPLTGFQTRRLLFRRELVGSNWNTVIRDASPHSQTITPLLNLAACPEAKGFVVVLLEVANPTTGRPYEPRATLRADYLYGDEVVVNINSGAALQMGAIAIQKGTATEPPIGTSFLDRQLDFNGLEYAAFPSIVSANFWAPNSDVDPRLIVFNVDINTHRVGGVFPPHTDCDVNLWDAEEHFHSGGLHFGCWTDSRLLDFIPVSHEDFLGTANGHLWLGCDAGTHGAIATALSGGHEEYIYSSQSGFSDTLFQSGFVNAGATLILTPDLTGGEPGSN
jgi:hypothetical protein